MSHHICPHETEVLDFVALEQWPQRADATLQAHVASCPQCAEVASIATAVREWGNAEVVPHVPESSVVWHRAQLRARAEAAHAAFRPLWLAQGFAVVALVVALVWMGPSPTWYASVWQSVSRSVPSIGTPNATPLPEGWVWAVGLVVAGVALFVSLVIGALRISERSELSK
ncbi:MAG TPA: hypothetical protein VMZ90_01820 [Vicinamibacterales bacterium]|nr:hypothetical protein [Vicinamibacterales bacterium]